MMTCEQRRARRDVIQNKPGGTGLDAVRSWSLKIHGLGQRHDWCIATANAILAGTPLPIWRGYSRNARSTANNRRTTIHRLLGLGERTDWEGCES